MSSSYSPTDPRTELQKNPRLSSDSEVDKNSAVPTTSKPVIHDRSGALGVAVKK